MSRIRFKTCNPAPALSGAVRELWILEDEGGDAAGLPKPYVEIVISLKGRHLWRATPEGPEHIYDCAWVTPLQSAPRFARSDGWRALVGARLHPLVARAIFAQLPRGDGTPPPHLADLIGEEAASLRQQVLGASSDEDKFACLERWLRRKLDGLPGGNRSYSWGAHHKKSPNWRNTCDCPNERCDAALPLKLGYHPSNGYVFAGWSACCAPPTSQIAGRPWPKWRMSWAITTKPI